MTEAWQRLIISEDEAQVAALVKSAKRVAVLGCKTEAEKNQPAFYVPRYLKDAGVEVIPVPVYYPEVQAILGLSVYRKVSEVPGLIDIVDVFRRAGDLPPHLDDILRAKPRAVWLQSGIRHPKFAESLARAGIVVVMDRCLMVDHGRFAG